MDKLDKCPVCGSDIAGSICQKCGYVRINFPSEIPAGLADFEQKRVDVLKDIVRQNARLVEDAGKDADAAKSREVRLRQSLDKREAEIASLESRISAQLSQIQRLSADLEETKNKMKVAAENMQADAFLIFMDGNDFTVYPIGKSKPKYFASGLGRTSAFNGNEDVAVFPVITGLEIAFEIRASARGYRIIDHCRTLRKEGMAVTGEERLMNKDSLSFAGAPFKASFVLSSRKK